MARGQRRQHADNLGERVDGLSPEWTFAGRLDDVRRPANATSFTFPVAIGVTSLPGKMRSVDEVPPKKIVDAPSFTVVRGGKYAVNDSFAVESISQ